MAKALPRLAAQQAISVHFKAIERNVVLAHAAITQHRDFTTAHALGRKWLLLAAACLGCEEHAQAVVVGGARLRTRQQRHQIAARTMRDPRLVAANAPAATRHLHGACAQRTEVGTGVRLGEHRRRQYLARRNLGQPFALLLRRAAAIDQLTSNLGSRAQRARCNPCATEFFGHDTHGALAQAHAAVFAVDADAEHAQFCQLAHHVIRNQRIFQMPDMRAWQHFLVGKAAELVANDVQVFVERRFGDGAARAEMLHQRAACFRRCSARVQRTRIGVARQFIGSALQAQLGRAKDFALRHGNAAGKLCQILAHTQCQDQLFARIQFTTTSQALAPGSGGRNRLHGRGNPCQAVQGTLVLLQQGRFRTACGRATLRNHLLGFAQITTRGVSCALKLLDELGCFAHFVHSLLFMQLR
ncbi:hypothetical protein SDC9_105047 [bioreactor metagenome]|uniref:Uncharacterized protein n=1 Tax=bioreactor metagenome TaxID=1076179 RepID=A0A645AZJ4_9ZZZZ